MRTSGPMPSTKNNSREIVCVCTNLKIASRAAARVLDGALAPLELNSTQYAILINISRHQPLSNVSLAELLGMDRTTLYRASEILARRSLIRIERAPSGNVHILRLSKQGERLTKKAKGEWEKVQGTFLSQFGAERYQAFLFMLREVQAYFSPAQDL